MTPREAGERAFYADEGNTLSGLKAAFDAYEAANWQPIETAPAGRCLMWVADSGERGKGQAVFGTVFIWPDSRSYRPDGNLGDWDVTHWMPIPAPPTISKATQGRD